MRIRTHVVCLSVAEDHQLLERFHVILDVREGPDLRAVSVDGDGLVSEDLTDPDPKDVPILVPDVLVDSEDVVRAHNRVPQTEHAACSCEVLFDRIFRDSVWILRDGLHRLVKWRILRTIDVHRRRENDLLDVVVDAAVHNVRRGDDVVGVVEASDERAQTHGGISREVIDIFGALVVEDSVDLSRRSEVRLEEFDAWIEVFSIASAEVVDTDDLVTLVEHVT